VLVVNVVEDGFAVVVVEAVGTGLSVMTVALEVAGLDPEEEGLSVCVGVGLGGGLVVVVLPSLDPDVWGGVFVPVGRGGSVIVALPLPLWVGLLVGLDVVSEPLGCGVPVGPIAGLLDPEPVG
jgi:hypothetical protein